MTLLFLAALAGGVVVFVLFPIFARASEVGKRPTATARERTSLLEKKDRIYEAIQDVDFEYQAGKLSDTDYKSVREDFLGQAAELIARLDELDASDVSTAETSQEAPDTLEQATQQVPSNGDEVSGPSCPSCQQLNPEGAQFCMRCGSKLTSSAHCPQCGAELQKEARFCTACGEAIPA